MKKQRVNDSIKTFEYHSCEMNKLASAAQEIQNAQASGGPREEPNEATEEGVAPQQGEGKSLRRSHSKLQDVAAAWAMGKSKAVRTRLTLQTMKDKLNKSKQANVSAEMMHDLYIARCQDTEERSSKEGLRQFRDTVEPNCRGEKFSVRSMRLGSNSCNVILRSLRHSAGITRVDLYRNIIRDQGVSSILELIRANQNIKHLNVGCNGIGNSGGLAVAEELVQNTSLVQLEMGSELDVTRLGNKMDNEACVKIAEAIRKNTTLSYLGLNRNRLSPESSTRFDVDKKSAYHSLSKTLTYNKTIEVLRLADTHIGTVGAIVLLESLHKNRTLWCLDMSDNKLSSEAGKAAGHMLTNNNSLAVLNFTGNQLGGRGAAALGIGLQTNHTLVSLQLDDNDIADLGAAYLAETLKKSKTLTSLGLSNNGITEIGGVALATALGTNKVLTTLNISDNLLGDNTAVALGSSLHSNSCLALLDLHNTAVGDKGSAYIATALQHNKSLRILKLSENHISEDGGKVFTQLLHDNTSLSQIALSGNQVDHSALLHLKRVCERNKQAGKAAAATPLKREIIRLRLQRNELADVKDSLVRVRDWISDAEHEIRTSTGSMEMVQEDEDVAMAKNEKQLELFQTSLEESTKKLQEREEELAAAEKEYGSKLSEVEEQLEHSAKAKQELASQLEQMTANAANPDQTYKDKAAELEKEIAELKIRKEALLEEAEAIRIEADGVKNQVFELQEAAQAKQSAITEAAGEAATVTTKKKRKKVKKTKA